MLTNLVACKYNCTVVAVDCEKGGVPGSFPGTIGLVTDPTGESQAIISPGYRQYGNGDNKEFYYFVHRILPAINPGSNNFRQRKTTDLISDIFTVTDEAFGLILLHNEYHVWEDQQGRKGSNKTITNVEKKRKRYCDAKSGSREGWMREGKELFTELCLRIVELRKRPETGVRLEEMIREKIVKESGSSIEVKPNSTTNQTKKVKETYKGDDVMIALYTKCGEIESI